MRFKVYVLISIIIHLIILIFSPANKQKERLIGEKITPIEIINNESFKSSKGNTNRNSKKIIDKKNKEKKKIIKQYKENKETNDLKLKKIDEKVTGDFQIKEKEISEKFQNKVFKNEKRSLKIEKKIDNIKTSNPQNKGVSDNEDNKDIEKGSIKGKGKLKITCLNCISPKYPRNALKKGLEGKPTVKVWILKSGNVEKAEIIISSGISSIDNAALKAARKSRFYPLPLDSFLNIQYDLKLK